MNEVLVIDVVVVIDVVLECCCVGDGEVCDLVIEVVGWNCEIGDV